MKKAFFFICILFFLAVVGGGLAYQKFISWSDKVTSPQEEVVIEFPRGTSLAALSKSLEKKGVVSKALYFKAFVKYFSEYQKFQAGNYLFKDLASPKEIISRFIAGDTYEPIVMEFTIPEGFTLKQFVSRLVAKKVSSEEELKNLLNDSSFIKELGVNAKTLEGFIFPATYSFTSMPTAKEVIQVTVEEFWKRLPKDYKKQVEAKGISLEEAVTFASLIELETPHDFERSFVSEVIWNRLNKGEALAIDATIIYGIPNFQGNLRFKHLRDASNLYNSRIHTGLPPTPIGSPSLASLEAVLTPSNKGYYFYVVDVKSEGGNKHHFSNNLKEHNRYVRELVRYSRRK